MSQSVSWKTVRSYLSAIRFFQIRSGYPDPSLSSFPRLTYVLKGIHRVTPEHKRACRLPITIHLLSVLHQAWSPPPVPFDRVMLCAACCLGFFGFLRAGEFTCSPAEVNDPPLMPDEISVDSRRNPQVVKVHLRQSKTDPFGAGCYVYLGRTSTTICPVAAILNYLSIRSSEAGPLFIFGNGAPLTRSTLVGHVREALSSRGVDATNYSGHSFRIGAATAAAQAGLSDSLIQALGRWKSSAFTTYIQTPPSKLALVAPALVSGAP